MITAALIEKIARDNVAGLEVDKTLFYEAMPLAKDGNPAEGVWLVTRGGSSQNNPNGINLHTIVDICVAFKNKIKTENVHQQLTGWIRDNRCICSLSGSIGGFDYDLSNIRMAQTTTPQNYGSTANGLVVMMASVEVYYDSQIKQ